MDMLTPGQDDALVPIHMNSDGPPTVGASLPQSLQVRRCTHSMSNKLELMVTDEPDPLQSRRPADHTIAHDR